MEDNEDMAVRRDLSSMTTYVINKNNVTRSTTSSGSSGSSSGGSSSGGSSGGGSSSSDKVKWENIEDIPVANKDTDGIISKETFSVLKDKVLDGIKAKDIETTDDRVFITSDLLRRVITLLNAHSQSATTVDSLITAITNLSSGDTLDINEEIDLSESVAQFSGIDVEVKLNKDVISSNAKTSGFRCDSGTVTITGEGLLKTETPFSSTNSTGIAVINGTGERIFDGSGISAVLDDPENNGQFGVFISGSSAKLTVNAGNFAAGWYCLTGNGTDKTPGSVITVNGGELRSISDYCIYHPHAGTLYVNGGYIYGAAGAICMMNGKCYITGGELTSDNTGDTGDKWSDGTGGQENACINLAAKYGPVEMYISGGKFTTANDTLFIIGTKNTVTLVITGGKFNVKPDAKYIADGYVCSDEPDEDGYYTVYQQSTEGSEENIVEEE